MTARPLVPECRRSLASAAVALVLLAMVMAAGCASYAGNGLCGGKFEVYELADFHKPGDNVVHLSEEDFKENPELDEVLRGAGHTNTTCDNKYNGFDPCIGGFWYKCGAKVRLIKYDHWNTTPDFADKRILEYRGNYYYVEFTMVA